MPVGGPSTRQPRQPAPPPAAHAAEGGAAGRGAQPQRPPAASTQPAAGQGPDAQPARYARVWHDDILFHQMTGVAVWYLLHLGETSNETVRLLLDPAMDKHYPGMAEWLRHFRLHTGPNLRVWHQGVVTHRAGMHAAAQQAGLKWWQP